MKNSKAHEIQSPISRCECSTMRATNGNKYYRLLFILQTWPEYILSNESNHVGRFFSITKKNYSEHCSKMVTMFENLLNGRNKHAMPQNKNA